MFSCCRPRKDEVTEPKPVKEKKDEQNELNDIEDEGIEKTGPIVAENFEELPEAIRKSVEKSGIDLAGIAEGKNFTVLLNVLRFTTRKQFQHKRKKNRERELYPGLEEAENSTEHLAAEEELVSQDLLQKTSECIQVEPNMKKIFKNQSFSGKGGFGQVYFAEQGKNIVAVKKMPHQTEKEIKANLTEIGYLRQCDHPNIVKYLSAYRVNNEIWLIMEFLEGGTLSDAVKGFKFKEPQIAFVAQEMLKALSYLHSKNYAHRDLKSSNVMMTVQGQIKLIDFGLCVDTSKGALRHMVGSPLWMPCEMIRGRSHTMSCDMWSFAVCMLEMVNGRAPQEQTTMKALYNIGTCGLDPVVSSSPCSDELKDLLLKCLRMVPSERSTPQQLLTHPFLKKADSVKSMEDIVKSVFISKTMINGGFL